MIVRPSSVSYCHTNSGLSIFNRLNLHPQLLTVGKNILSINIRIPLIYNSIPLRVHFLLLYIYIMYWTARREKHNRSSGSEISYWSSYFDLRTFPLLMRDQWKQTISEFYFIFEKKVRWKCFEEEEIIILLLKLYLKREEAITSFYKSFSLIVTYNQNYIISDLHKWNTYNSM